MSKQREARIRALKYAGLAVLALAALSMVLYLTGTPGWDAPLKMPSVGMTK